MRTIGVGVISFAHGHGSTYCDQMIRFNDVKLVACWDDNEERGRGAAERFGMIYTPHIEDVLGHPRVDAVIVTCETNRHAEMVVAAAEAALPIHGAIAPRSFDRLSGQFPLCPCYGRSLL